MFIADRKKKSIVRITTMSLFLCCCIFQQNAFASEYKKNGFPCVTKVCLGDGIEDLSKVNWQGVTMQEEDLRRSNESDEIHHQLDRLKSDLRSEESTVESCRLDAERMHKLNPERYPDEKPTGGYYQSHLSKLQKIKEKISELESQKGPALAAEKERRNNERVLRLSENFKGDIEEAVLYLENRVFTSKGLPLLSRVTANCQYPVPLTGTFITEDGNTDIVTINLKPDKDDPSKQHWKVTKIRRVIPSVVSPSQRIEAANILSKNYADFKVYNLGLQEVTTSSLALTPGGIQMVEGKAISSGGVLQALENMKADEIAVVIAVGDTPFYLELIERQDQQTGKLLEHPACGGGGQIRLK